MNPIKFEPVLFYSLLASIAIAILQAATTVGFTWNWQHVLQLAAPLVAGFLARFVVTSPATMERLRLDGNLPPTVRG
jgi:hypothetical protein